MGEKEYTFQFVGKPVEIIEDELPEINTNIKLIAGKLNNCNTVYYWEIQKETPIKIGDYAIVENINDYDLVKIVGAINTSEKYAKFITNSKVNKKVVMIIDRYDIRND